MAGPAPSNDVVTVDFRKYPATPHWRFDMYRLGEDEHGTWLWAPGGTKARRGSEPPVHFRGRRVKLLTHRDWWTAIWGTEGRSEADELAYVDIATPVEWIEGTAQMIDLDLDIRLNWDGTAVILDEDEFAAHQVELGYPDKLIDAARTTTARVYLDATNGVAPFGDVAESWLLEADELDRPPL